MQVGGVPCGDGSVLYLDLNEGDLEWLAEKGDNEHDLWPWTRCDDDAGVSITDFPLPSSPRKRDPLESWKMHLKLLDSA